MDRRKVSNGDCLLSLSLLNGFYWKTIWEDPKNKDLKENKREPNMLVSDDRVHIPIKKNKVESVDSGSKHSFVLKGLPIVLRLRLIDEDGPISDEPYKLRIGVKEYSGSTDSKGMISHNIAPTEKRGELTVGKGISKLVYRLSIGSLMPVSEISGIQARLNGLGFDCGKEDGDLGTKSICALRAFQAKYTPENITGTDDEQTRGELKNKYEM